MDLAYLQRQPQFFFALLLRSLQEYCALSVRTSSIVLRAILWVKRPGSSDCSRTLQTALEMQTIVSVRVHRRDLLSIVRIPKCW